jgi:hypothetical protein
MSLAERTKPSAPVGLKHLLSAEAEAFLLEAAGVSFLRKFRSLMARKSSWKIRVWDSSSRSEIARCRASVRCKAD